MKGSTKAARIKSFSSHDGNGLCSMRLQICHSIVFIFLVLITGSLAVTIKNQAPVTLRLPAEKLTLPCEFCTDAENSSLCYIIWERGLQKPTTVVSGYKSGETFLGTSYSDRARLTTSCSSELDNPKVSDSGTYRVEVVCPEANSPRDTALLNVTILTNSGGVPFGRAVFRDSVLLAAVVTISLISARQNW